MLWRRLVNPLIISFVGNIGACVALFSVGR